MKLDQVRAIAKSHSVKPGNLSNAELIRLIQAHEGNFDCYGTAFGGECDQANCLWRGDCFDSSQG